MKKISKIARIVMLASISSSYVIAQNQFVKIIKSHTEEEKYQKTVSQKEDFLNTDSDPKNTSNINFFVYLGVRLFLDGIFDQNPTMTARGSKILSWLIKHQANAGRPISILEILDQNPQWELTEPMREFIASAQNSRQEELRRFLEEATIHASTPSTVRKIKPRGIENHKAKPHFAQPHHAPAHFAQPHHAPAHFAKKEF
jgi:hypothetical protein